MFCCSMILWTIYLVLTWCFVSVINFVVSVAVLKWKFHIIKLQWELHNCKLITGSRCISAECAAWGREISFTLTLNTLCEIWALEWVRLTTGHTYDILLLCRKRKFGSFGWAVIKMESLLLLWRKRVGKCREGQIYSVACGKTVGNV